MRCRIALLSALLALAPLCLSSQEPPPTPQPITLADIESLRLLFQSILTNAEGSETDLSKLNSLFDNWESEIKRLPTLQEKVLSLSQENTGLKIGVAVVSVVAVLEGVALILKK